MIPFPIESSDPPPRMFEHTGSLQRIHDTGWRLYFPPVHPRVTTVAFPSISLGRTRLEGLQLLFYLKDLALRSEKHMPFPLRSRRCICSVPNLCTTHKEVILPTTCLDTFDSTYDHVSGHIRQHVSSRNITRTLPSDSRHGAQ